MELHKLSPVPGSTKVSKRKGLGLGSGWGKTAGRGHKGQNARSGGGKGPGFEGGQMKLTMRLPKRGFHNKFRVDYDLVNVQALDIFDQGAVVGPVEMKEAGLMRRNAKNLKILGEGEIEKALTVKAHAFSQSAKEKIETAGGKVEVI